jgi:hypothetical protein
MPSACILIVCIIRLTEKEWLDLNSYVIYEGFLVLLQIIGNYNWIVSSTATIASLLVISF